MSKPKRLVLIDSHAILHRSFHALPPLTSPDGRQVNAVYGFTSTLLKAIKDLNPQYIACAFDLPGPKIRKELYTEYQSNRPKAVDEFVQQIPLVREVLGALHIPIYAKEGYEADDILGTISKLAAAQGLEVIIVTGDMDILQLVDDQVSVYTMRRGLTDTVIYDPAKIQERFGFKAIHIIDYKALRGDTSDNIPGVPGIGEKTATDLIIKYGSLAGVYQNLSQITGSLHDKLEQGRASAELSFKLATIMRDVEVEWKLEDCVTTDFDRSEVARVFQQFGFKSLLAKIPNEKSTQQMGLFAAGNEQNIIQAPAGANYVLVDNEPALKALAKKLSSAKEICLDTETDGLDSLTNGLLGISLSCVPNEAYYVAIADYHLEKKGLPLATVVKYLAPIFSDPKIGKVAHHAKFDYEVLRRHGLPFSPLTLDTMLASYIVNSMERSHGLDNLAFVELGHEMIPITALIGTGKNQSSLNGVDIQKVATYAAEDVDFTLKLKEHFAPKINPVFKKLLDEIELPLVYVLAEMEQNGILLDVPFLQKMSKELNQKLSSLQQEICKLAGCDFNINSPQQMADVLFNKLKLNIYGLKKTTSGFSTAAGELQKLKGAHPVVDMVLEYRELAKLINTYIDTLPLLIGADKRIHTSYNQTTVATGRLSSSNPNLQNIPVRTKLGEEIRKAFVATPGHLLLSADYSQIELRVVAHMSGDENMIKAFESGEDIHTSSAALVNGIKPAEVTSTQRRFAKTINFGVLYGMSAFGLSQSLEISRTEAQNFIDNYFAKYAGIKKFLEQTKQQARTAGYVETIFGRRRYIPEINSSNPSERNTGERMAINMPVQGTAADIIKLAMIEVQKQIWAGTLKAKMLLQVHDELVFELKPADLPEVSRQVKTIMEGIYKLSVPLVADLSVGENWGTMKDLE